MARKKKTDKLSEGKTKGNVKESNVNDDRPSASPPPRVPPRATEEPVVAKPATPEVQQQASVNKAPVPNTSSFPRFPQEEVDYLVYIFNLAQHFKHKAGFKMEGTALLNHDMEMFAKAAQAAIQRTQMVNKLLDMVNAKTKELEDLKAKLAE